MTTKETDIEDFFKDGPSLYTKFEDGTTTKLRLITDFVIGWEGWFGNKPVRFAADHKWTSEELNTLDVDDELRPKKKQFMATVVWNYNEGAFQIWSITQAGIRKTLLALRNDTDWGGLTKHDIKVTRTGKGFDTTYNVIPSPGEAPKDLEAKFKESKLDPKMLIEDDKNKENVDRFQSASKSTDESKELETENINPDDIPF